MLIGMPKKPSPQQSASAPDDALIFDVGIADFEARVLKVSMTVPVLVDFWAAWCGPCKQLTPTLEQLVREAKGAVKLAKVNVDENPELSQAFRIQSLPTVLAIFGGQPVTGFMGAQPASQIKAIIDQLTKMAKAQMPEAPEALDVPETLKAAAQALAAGDLVDAQGLYAAILGQEPTQAEAYVGMIRTFIAAGEVAQAEGLVTNAPDDISKSPVFAQARTALELAKSAPAGDVAALERAVAANAKDCASAFDLAQIYFARGRREAAIDLLLEIVRTNRAWENDKARGQILKYFEALGPVDPLTVATRKKLSTILFS